MSSLLHGPASIGKPTARQRAASAGESKAHLWGPKRITPGFVAFTCTLVCNVLRGEEAFRLSSSRKGGNLNLETYDRILDMFRNWPASQVDRVLDHLTAALIPDDREGTEELDDAFPNGDDWNAAFNSNLAVSPSNLEDEASAA
ncbi:hypothetical protein JCM11491_003574 [Sporobolomyces phaffii]